MTTGAQAHRDGAGYSAREVTKAPEWHGLVAWDMLFNNLTTGLFLTAALGELVAPELLTRVAKAAYPLALFLLVADLLCLVLDLGDPLRFHHMLRVFKPASPMSLGTWCLTIYSLPLSVAAALSLLPDGWPVLEGVRKAAVVLGILPAVGSAAYKGVLLSTTAQPGWREARWLGGYLTNSALLLGSAEMLLLAALLGDERAGSLLRPALKLLLVLNLIPFGLVVRDLRPSLCRAYTPRQLSILAAFCVGMGTVVPLALLLVEGSFLLLTAAVIFVLLGSLASRFVIVRLPRADS
jgi:hypothetical protein